MIVRRLEDCAGTSREVKGETWSSRRLLLREDKVGFSFHDTILGSGTETRMWYRNHIEAVYCIAGKATLEDLDSGEIHDIGPGTIYCLNGHEKHVLRVEEEVRMMCVFNPAVVGTETHDADGAYPLLPDPEPAADAAN